MALILQILTGASLLLHLASAVTDFSVTNARLAKWNQSEWSLETSSYLPGQYQSRISLGNGYVGASLAAAGPFFELDVNQTDPNVVVTNGWPLFSPRMSFSTISGFYDVQKNGTGTNYPWLNQYGWESFISGIPHSTGIIFAFGDNYLDATASNTTISNFKSSISFKTGVATWQYTWTPANSTAHFDVSFTTFFSRVRPNVIAVQAAIVASQDISGNVTDLLDGRSAMRTYLDGKGMTDNSTIYCGIHPSGLANVTGYVVSTADFTNPYTNLSSRVLAEGKFISSSEATIGQTYNINLKAGQIATFSKYVGVASTDEFPGAQSVARQASLNAQKTGWITLYSEHSEAWQALMKESTVDDFRDPVTGDLPTDELLQILHIASVANTFYLLQNLQPDGSDLNDNSIAVGGLASESYAGMIFWDADYWMAPGLNLAYPGYSKQISNFRIKQHPQALANAAFNGYPNGSSLYSWTAGRYGNCTGTGPCVDYEYHLNYDIAFNLLQQFNITQNVTWFNNGPRQIIESTAMMTGQLLRYNETTKSYWLHNATDPDEFANNVDNPVFTIASAAELLTLANDLRVQQGQSINQTWDTQARSINYPVSPASNITLEYETMNNNIQVKQADVVLISYPLDYSRSNYTAADKLMDLDYYSNRQSPNGPAMTYSIFAVDANALSPSGCAAYTYTLNGFLPYLRAPWYQFSEQAVDDPGENGGTNPAFPFLTGHGGANQVVPFGFLGLRTDQDVLYVNPSLPPQIPQLRIRNFYFAGTGLSAFMNQTHTTFTRLSTQNITAVTEKYANTSLPFIVGTPDSASEYTINYLPVNGVFTIPNRLYFQNITYAHNILQCLPVASSDPYLPGQFPVAANDGATATRWQPVSNISASILINTSTVPYQRIRGMYFDWGVRPPRNATVYLGNETALDPAGNTELWGAETKLEVDDIVVSQPYSAAQANASAAEGPKGVVPVTGNSTTVAIANSDEVWSGQYVRLVVEGCWEDDGVGATVGEVVLLGG